MGTPTTENEQPQRPAIDPDRLNNKDHRETVRFMMGQFEDLNRELKAVREEVQGGRADIGEVKLALFGNKKLKMEGMVDKVDKHDKVYKMAVLVSGLIGTASGAVIGIATNWDKISRIFK